MPRRGDEISNQLRVAGHTFMPWGKLEVTGQQCTLPESLANALQTELCFASLLLAHSDSRSTEEVI